MTAKVNIPIYSNEIPKESLEKIFSSMEFEDVTMRFRTKEGSRLSDYLKVIELKSSPYPGLNLIIYSEIAKTGYLLDEFMIDENTSGKWDSMLDFITQNTSRFTNIELVIKEELNNLGVLLFYHNLRL